MGFSSQTTFAWNITWERRAVDTKSLALARKLFCFVQLLTKASFWRVKEASFWWIGISLRKRRLLETSHRQRRAVDKKSHALKRLLFCLCQPLTKAELLTSLTQTKKASINRSLFLSEWSRWDWYSFGKPLVLLWFSEQRFQRGSRIGPLKIILFCIESMNKSTQQIYGVYL